MKDNIINFFKKLYEWFVSFVKTYEPWQLILMIATPLLIISLFITIPKEIEHAKLIPLGFSEIEQIEIDMEKKNKPVDSPTNYYAPLNDLLNKIFECWNVSLKFGTNDDHDPFARELDSRKDKIWKYEFDLFDSVPLAADKFLLTLKNWIALMPTLDNTYHQFGKNWKYETEDDYITVQDYKTDEDGNTVSDGSHQEYDHTHHYFTYYKSQGEYSYQVGMRMLKYFPRLYWPGNLLQASRTNAEGEYAADRSRRVDRHNQEELFEITRKWNQGSLYMTLKGDILEYNNMYGRMKVWEKQKDTAEYTELKTNSKSNPGPEEYQTSEYIKMLANGVLNAIGQLRGTIINTKNALPVLKNKIDTYIKVTLEGKKGNSNELRDEILTMAKDLYRQNFPEGLDLNTFRFWVVLLWAFIASVIGALIGFVLKVIYYDNDRYGNYNPYRYRRY